MLGQGIIKELVLAEGQGGARIECEPSLIPSPGQYVLAYATGSRVPLATAIFPAKIAANEFLAAPPIPPSWAPGVHLQMRGPLGRGFSWRRGVRRAAFLALDGTAARMLHLVQMALGKGASAAFLSPHIAVDLPPSVEIRPMAEWQQIWAWADQLFIDSPRESLAEVRKMVALGGARQGIGDTQILIRTPMPCGSLADCGACALAGSGPFVCRDGPVFPLKDLARNL